MNCPVCERSLAPTLSICPTCGAMMNDTVREELQSKITAGTVAAIAEPKPERVAAPSPKLYKTPAPASVPAHIPQRVQTANLTAPKTSPTLVEFQHKSPAIPDWRLQLQNAVQQRKGAQSVAAERQPLAATAPAPQQRQASPAQNIEQHTEPSDPRVANAMKRIAESRKAFSEPDPTTKRAVQPGIVPSRPFGVVGTASAAAIGVAPTSIPVISKPRLVNAAAPMAFKRDTNKLQRIEMAEPVSAPLDMPAVSHSGPIEKPVMEFAEIKRIHIRAEDSVAEDLDWTAGDPDEIEDLAPFSMRFGAGLFDFIIGTFASMVLLSPIAFTSSDWLTGMGLLTFGGTISIVMFLYMTITLGFLGKTIGMKLFSLELVDAVENEYPTLRQAAVNSGIFLISTLFAGVGFLTVFFNEEKRALHDLLSGTILVREF